MGGWVKVFDDKTFEMGTDPDVKNGLASWSRGRLDHMVGVSVKSGDQHIAIKGSGEYWQSDDFEVPVFSNDSVLITRRIMKRIETGERIFTILQTEHSTMITVSNLLLGMDETDLERNLQILPKDSVDKWLVLEYLIPSKTVRWYLSLGKI